MIHLYRRRRSRGGGGHDDDDDDSQDDATDIITASTIKYQTIQHWEKGQLLRLSLFTIRTSCLHWDVVISINTYTLSIMLFGFIGGFLTSITGSGADLLVFATSYFIFHIDRSTAIATSVAVMSITSIAAYYYYQFEKNFILQEVYSIWLIAIPCVSIGLPMSTIATIKFLPAFSNRMCVNVFNIVQFIIIIILLMTSTLQHSNTLLISSTIIFIIAMIFFVSIMFIGRRDDVYLNNHVLVATSIAGETIAQMLIKPDSMEISGGDGEENKDSEGDDTQITESDDTIGRDRKMADVCYDDDGNWVMTLPSTSAANSPMVEYGRIYGSMLPSPLMTPYKGSPNVEYADVYQSHCYYHHDSDSQHREEGGKEKGGGEADQTNSPKFEYDRSDSVVMVV
jgi:uncharacterized membrane protein YfcA